MAFASQEGDAKVRPALRNDSAASRPQKLRLRPKAPQLGRASAGAWGGSAARAAPGRSRLRVMRRMGLTGGPGGGKPTAPDLFRRELGTEVAVVPEAATIL